MQRRAFLHSSMGSLAAGSLPAQQGGYQAAFTPTSRPNVIWLFGDQHRAQALSCNGDPNVSTPNIDRLADGGVHFTQAVAGFPLCCPFRGSLLTGRYPHHCVPGHEYPLPSDQPTVAQPFGKRAITPHGSANGTWVDGTNEMAAPRSTSPSPSSAEGSIPGLVMRTTTHNGRDLWEKFNVKAATGKRWIGRTTQRDTN